MKKMKCSTVLFETILLIIHTRLFQTRGLSSLTSNGDNMWKYNYIINYTFLFKL